MTTDSAQRPAEIAERHTPGTLLRDSTGSFWLVRDDGMTAAGTNGGVMVDLRRGRVVYSSGGGS